MRVWNRFACSLGIESSGCVNGSGCVVGVSFAEGVTICVVG